MSVFANKIGIPSDDILLIVEIKRKVNEWHGEIVKMSGEIKGVFAKFKDYNTAVEVFNFIVEKKWKKVEGVKFVKGSFYVWVDKYEFSVDWLDY